MSDLISSLIFKKCCRKDASFFALYFGKNYVKYCFALSLSKRKMMALLSGLSLKARLFKILIYFMPYFILEKLKLGYFCELEIDNIVLKKIISNYSNIAVLVGTPDNKQKIVFHLEDENGQINYLKYGDYNTTNEIKNEGIFLKNFNNKFKSFKMPEFVDYQCVNNYSYLISKEVKGCKKNLKMKEILDICNELKLFKKDNMYLSHGDFAPWNVVKSKDIFLFDWENWSYRIENFDLMHYLFSIQYRLKKRNFNESFTIALKKIRRYDSGFFISFEDFKKEFIDLHKL